MSDHSISIVPKLSCYPDGKAKAKEILDWLGSMEIVKTTLSDCVLGSDSGYALSDGAKSITHFPGDLPFDLITNGLEIITERQIFHTGEGGLEDCICPNCQENIVPEIGRLFEEWFEQEKNKVTCVNCHIPSEINNYKFFPEWGFSDLGFTFWNWPELTEEFIGEVRHKLGVDISIVNTHT